MSARFHLYLCGRIAAEWLINMSEQDFKRVELYSHSVHYAREHGELDAYRASYDTFTGTDYGRKGIAEQ